MSEPPSLFEDLKQRRVIRAVAIYAVVGWGTFEVVESVAPYFALPDWVPRLVLLVLMAGFPIVAGLAWAFDLRASGVSRAPGLGGRRILVPILGASLLAVLMGVWTWRATFDGGGPTPTLDPDRLAVVPFRATVGPDLEYLGEGMVDLLNARLASESEYRAVDPASIFAVVDPDALPTRDALVEISRDLGAGRLVTGTVTGDAGGLEVTAFIVDVEEGSDERVTVNGSPSDLPGLVDRVAVQLLSLDAGEREDRVEYLAGSPPEAIHAYLRGRALYRRGAYEDAAAALLEAVRIDSTLALAGMTLIDANGMVAVSPPGATALGFNVTLQNQDRLPPTDREYVRLRTGGTYPDERSARERLQDAERTAAQFPDRLDAWYFLADRLFHDGRYLGVENYPTRSRQAFERMLEIDPNSVTAVQHLLWAGIVGSDTSFAQSMADRLRTLSASPVGAFQAAMFTADTAELSRLEQEMGDWAEEALLQAAFFGIWQVGGWPLFHDFSEAALVELQRGGVAGAAAEFLFVVSLEGGRPEAAHRFLDQARRGSAGGERRLDRMLLATALFDDGDEAAAEQAFDRARSRLSSLDQPFDEEDVLDHCYVGLWRAYRRGLEGVTEVLTSLRAVGNEEHHTRAQAEACGLMLEATLAVSQARADAGEVVDRLDEWTLRGEPVGAELVHAVPHVLASLYGELGDDEGEYGALLRCCKEDQSLRHYAQAKRKLGYAALQVGDTATAVRALDYYVAVRERAEPSVQPDVEQARTELGRLVGEGR